ncbi:His Phos 2 domain containing protein [Asbolus verrucosus]|uniref:acid phosphatase n=1 Tax=Asbolus verrucosus TaxID=1661398 RepID=A0A482W9R9_ASBVE|nr:His Phos 2 domain containing protein [Asbolus verrucosus]
MKFSLVFLQLFLTVVSVDLAPTEDTLVLLHVLFRHGNRTPDKFGWFPKDPHADNNFEPFGFSQLTTKGKATEYKIGQYLRRTYGKFIPQQYTPDVLYALSTNYKRTKMSLQLVLASLFPPLATDVFVDDLNWQPIPFNIEQGAGLIGIPFHYCINFAIHYSRYERSEEAQKILAGYKELYQQVTTNTGIEVESPQTLANIFGTLESEYDIGLKLPEWTSEIFPEVLEEAAGVFFEFATGNTILKKYSAGHLLRKILKDSLSKRKGILPEGRKIFLYSAHDYNVAAVLRTLNVFNRHVPPYGATVFFEIHNIEGIYGLKLYYQDYKQTDPKLLTVPGCSSFCELDKLYRLIEEYLPGENDACTPLHEIH